MVESLSASERPVIGVVGGGQLARMMIQAAISLDVDLRILAAHQDDAAARITPTATIGDWHDLDDLRAFAAACDVVTFDHELVDPDTVARLEACGALVRPGAGALRVAADKAAQRDACAALGIAVPEHVIATAPGDVAEAARRFGYPLVAKLTRGGYDGRGVFWLADATATGQLFERLPPGAVVVVEPALDLQVELATQVVRRADGTSVCYPVVQTHQVDGICTMVQAPAAVAPALAQQAQDWARRLADHIGVVGVLAVEYFLTDQGLLVNELAPRPHNTGHHSIDACATSQFENHLRAVLDLPLGSPDLIVPAAVMVNLIAGRTASADLGLLTADPRARVHRYGKASRPGRKIGHVTLCGTDRRGLVHRATELTGLDGPGAASRPGSPTRPRDLEVTP